MKTLLILVVLLFSFSVLAENWIEFGSNNNGTTNTIMYVDYDLVDKKNGYLNIVTLFDFSPKINGVIGSLKFLKRYDCDDFKTKLLRTIYYKDQMGKGDVYDDDSENEGWEYLIPNSNEYALLEVFCSKF